MRRESVRVPMRSLIRQLAPLPLVFAMLWSNQRTPVVTRAQAVPLPGSGYWHTAGTQILDALNHPVRIAALTWYGMESSRWVPAGLDFQPYTVIMDEVKLLGFNVIRLPFSNELVERNPIVTGSVAANPALRGIHALTLLDDIVAYAGRIGLKIILDDHRSKAARPTGVNTLDEWLWYTRAYPESAWISDWQMLARRYLGNDTVVGFDLRNEPHTNGPGPYDLSAYLRRSATWGPYHGVDNTATDWRLAAERAGDAVLAINPRLLVIVQGLPLYPAHSQPGGILASWWAGLLTPARKYPVELNVLHQLVYSIHEWGPRKHSMPWFSPPTEKSLNAAWHRNWAFLLDHPNAPYAAPIWIGEFGTCTDDPDCLLAGASGGQGTWFRLLARWLRAHPQVGWSFYALNGTNSNNCAADNGLLNPAWNALANRALLVALRRLEPVPGTLPARASARLLPNTATLRRPRSATSALCRLP